MIVTGDTSDGFHTFNELYAHRIALFQALCRHLPEHIECWRSRLHSDGSSFEGWFIAGINYKKGEQITYHLPDSEWKECDFMSTLDSAPEWDGHSPGDVVNRIKDLL